MSGFGAGRRSHTSMRPPTDTPSLRASKARSSPHPSALLRPCLRPSVPSRQNRLQRRLAGSDGRKQGRNRAGGCGEDRASYSAVRAPWFASSAGTTHPPTDDLGTILVRRIYCQDLVVLPLILLDFVDLGSVKRPVGKLLGGSV